jgi:PAS domain S-box-containing protein
MSLERFLSELPADHELRPVLAALNAHAIVSIADEAGTILYVNQRFCETSGYQPDELIGRNHNVVRSDQHDRTFYRDMWQTISSGRRWHGEICNRRKNGSYYWVDSTIAPVLSSHGGPVRYLSIRTDITALKENEARLAAAQAFANIGTWDWNIRTGELYWSQRVPPLYGYPQGKMETTYEGFLNAVHPDDRQAVIDSAQMCLKHQAEYDIEHRCIWPDGSVHWLHERGDITRDSRGNPLHMIGVVEDITDRKQGELALKESQQRLEEAQRVAHLGHWQWHSDKQQLWWSDMVYRIYGYEPGTLQPSLGHAQSAIHAEDQAKVRAAEQRARETGHLDVTHRIVRPDGGIRTVHQKGELRLDAEGQPAHILGTIQDVTEQTTLEANLAAKSKLLDILRQALIRFVTADSFEQVSEYLLHQVIDLTDSAYGMIGLVREDAAGQPTLEVTSFSHAGWGDARDKLYQDFLQHGLVFGEPDTLLGPVFHKGQLVISNDVAGDERAGHTPAGHPELKSFMGVPVYHGEKLVAVYGLANRPGGYNHGLVDQLALFNASYGVMVHAHAIAQAEAASREETERARKLAEKASQAKSEFLSAMSHELRTPLNAILGFAQLLSLDEATLNADQQDNVNEILRAGEHLLELINEVLDLAKIEAGRIDLTLGPIHIDKILDECCKLLQPLVQAKQIRYECRASSSPYQVRGDYIRVKQVLLNLLSNALKYNRPQGSVRVEQTLCDNHRLRVAVHDTGIGIREADLARLFQPFQRLNASHADVEGTGIGLAISKRLIEAMGGCIGAESRPGEGSVFWLELPLGQGAMARTQPADDKQPIPLGQGDGPRRILYVEDNPANMRLMEQILSRQRGIELLSAPSPELALDLAPTFQPHLLLLDINLPRISGVELLAQLRQIPGLSEVPAIAVSANAMSADVDKGLAHGFVDYLTKPINVQRLHELLDTYLYGTAAGESVSQQDAQNTPPAAPDPAQPPAAGRQSS